MSADAPTKEGLNAHAIIFDELHAQEHRKLWDTLRYAGASRRQPLLGAITTAGWDRESICWEQRQIAEAVIADKYDAWDFLAVIYGASQEDDWRSPSTWRKANPSLGVTIQESDLASACAEAVASPRKENSFKRYRLNIWTEQATRWLNMEDWDACEEEFDLESLSGRTAYVGIDLASKIDLAAMAMVFPPAESDPLWRALTWAYLPHDTAVERDKQGRGRFLQWAGEKAALTLTPGNVCDYQFIRKQLQDVAPKVRVGGVGYDPYNATHFALQLRDEDGFDVIEVRQGAITLSEPCKELEKLLVSKQFRHNGDPVLRWCASNVSVREDANGNIRPDKEKSSDKIDCIAAILNAMRLAITCEKPKQSVYEKRDMVFL